MDKFETYKDLLLRYNKVHNISGVKNADEVDNNIEDSLYPIKFLDMGKIDSVLDIGTGAGFPGLILSIAYPDISFVLAEPNLKKAAFLHLVKSTLNLENVTIKSERVEEIEPFYADLITSRAVSKSSFLIDIAQDFIGKNSVLLFYKGENVQKEIEEKWQYEIINRNKRNYLFIKGIK